MSSKLESIAGQIKSNHRISEIVQVVAKNVNPILIQQVDNVDIKDMMKGFQTFQENFDKLNVNANVISDGFDRMPADTTEDKANDLFNQIKNKFQADTNLEGVQTTKVTHQETQQTQNADFDKYLNDLKN